MPALKKKTTKAKVKVKDLKTKKNPKGGILIKWKLPPPPFKG